MNRTMLFCTLGLLALSPSILGQDAKYLGAEEVLKQAMGSGKVPDAKPADPVVQLRDKVKAFEAAAATLPPAEAASQWLALLDTWLLLPQQKLYSSSRRVEMEDLVRALPPTSAWDLLVKELQTRAEAATDWKKIPLQLLAAALSTDDTLRKASVQKAAAALEEDPRARSHQREEGNLVLAQLSEEWQLNSRGDTALKAFEKQLAQEETDIGSFYMITVPDLLSRMNEADAAPLLVRALRANSILDLEGTRTRRLTARLALAHINELKQPVWDLVEGSEDLALYEALAKKFPKPSADVDRSEADAVYVVTLVQMGRMDDAVKAAIEAVERQKAINPNNPFTLDGSVLQEMAQKGAGSQILNFVRTLLEKDPSLPFWPPFIALSAQQGEATGTLEPLRNALAQPTLAGAHRAQVEAHYCMALLAADQVEEGIKTMRRLLKARTQSAKLRDGSAKRDDMELAMRMAKLGRLLEMPGLVNDAVEMARATYEAYAAGDTHPIGVFSELAVMLVEHGRGPEAEALCAAALERVAQPANSRGYDDGQRILATLAFVYHRAGKSEEIVRLLDKAPWWGGYDLAMLSREGAGEDLLLLLVAKALNATGRQDAARKVALRALQQYPANDAVYAFVLTLDVANFGAQMDVLHARDRFEERPLIWKAQFELNAARLAEAEAAVRAAIAIDPSDGEQGHGDRMRAYAVLGDILERKGDADQAKTMRGAVAAIRLSEKADEWWEAGMLSRAIKLYEDSLKLFADAYCIQSRLALRYSEMGDFAKAEEHYLRAFELMPESFGRVESHCFGCEGAFRGERAQSIADQVFTKLAAKKPDRAQVFYLLGYLRSEEGRHQEALEAYRRAVKLDPDYLNAWQKLAESNRRVEGPTAEWEDALLAILRLAPTRHGSHEVRSFSKLRRLWETLLAVEASLPKSESGPLYPLPAARLQWEKSLGDRTLEDYFSQFDASDQRLREILAQTTVMSSISNLTRSLRHE